MDKIEQAREVSARIWNAGYTDESATIDALIAELEKVTREAHENKDKARWANAELERIKSQEPVAWMTQSGNPVLYKSAEQAVLYGWNPLFLAAGAQSIPDGYQLVPVEPTAGMKTAAIGVEVYADSPLELGALTWHEASAIYKAMLAAAPQAQPVQQEPFGYVSEHNCQGPFQFQFHKDSSTVYTDNCKSITAVYAAPVQAQERKSLKASEIVTMYAEQPMCDADMIEFAREVEAAHGIKEQP